MLSAKLCRIFCVIAALPFGHFAIGSEANARLDALSKRAMEAGARQDYPGALNALREGSRSAQEAGALRRAALFENALCAMSFMAMDFTGSFRACASAIRIALASHETEIAGVAELNRANFYLSLGDTAGAEVGLSRALALLAANSRYKPIALATLGTIQARRGQYDSARQTLTTATVLAGASPDRTGEAFAYGALGAFCLHAGRHAEAEQALLNNFRIRRLHRLPLLEAAWRQLAELRLAQGEPAEAVRFLTFGLEARKSSRSFTSFLTWEVMGKALQRMGQRQNARSAFRRALEESKPWRDEIAPSDSLEIAADVRLASLVSSFASVSSATGSEAWEVFEAIESVRAAGLRRQVLANRALAGKLSTEQLALVRTSSRLRRLALSGDAHAAEELKSVEFSLRGFDNESDRRIPTMNAGGHSPFDAQRLTGTLKPGQVLISFLADPRTARIWVLSRKGRASAALPDFLVLSKAIESYRAAILAGRDPLDEGQQLYRLLFSGIPKTLLDAPNWSVVADGPLWSIPWSALVQTADQGRRYLIESKSLEVLPSATWLLSAESSPDSSTMLAAGNAIHNQADERFKTASLELTAVPLSFWVWPSIQPQSRPDPIELPGLAGSHRELLDACRAWTAGPCTILSGADLTLEGLTREVSRHPAVVHLATHLLVVPDHRLLGSTLELGQGVRALPSSGEAFLALSLRPDLTRESVQPVDVSRLCVPGALVVLSACGSGQGTVLPGAGLQGFGRAWLASGARAVVTTLWPVSDETSLFFRGFYSALSKTNHPAQALRSAQLQALRRRDWQSKPRFWAAYTLLGKD